MSGGFYDYKNYLMNEWIESTEDEFLKIVEEDRYNDEVYLEIQKGIELMKKASIYMHRMDWLFSGDDGGDAFQHRLEEDFKSL